MSFVFFGRIRIRRGASEQATVNPTFSGDHRAIWELRLARLSELLTRSARWG